jgi:pimeloyl-ACP methyl ester carboxylesterase
MKRESLSKIRGAVSGRISDALGPKPLIHYSHRGALKIFEALGFRFEVRRFGESRIGLLRWPLRKLPAGTAPRRIVFTPGFGDTPLSWWTILAALKPVLSRKADEVVLVDFPGYGGFLHEETAFDSVDELFRCYRETLSSLQPKILMGHSLGGWLSADYAIEAERKRPGSLDELILIDPGGVVGTEEDKQNYRDLFTRATETGSRDLLGHVFARAPFWVTFFEDEFFHFLKAPEIRAFVASFEERHLLNDRLADLQAKTTVLWGDRDTMTPVLWIEKWMELLPHAEKRVGVLIKGCGHSPQIEKPGVVIALLTQILLGRKPIAFRRMPFWKVL